MIHIIKQTPYNTPQKILISSLFGHYIWNIELYFNFHFTHAEFSQHRNHFLSDSQKSTKTALNFTVFSVGFQVEKKIYICFRTHRSYAPPPS